VTTLCHVQQVIPHTTYQWHIKMSYNKLIGFVLYTIQLKAKVTSAIQRQKLANNGQDSQSSWPQTT